MSSQDPDPQLYLLRMSLNAVAKSIFDGCCVIAFVIGLAILIHGC